MKKTTARRNREAGNKVLEALRHAPDGRMLRSAVKREVFHDKPRLDFDAVLSLLVAEGSVKLVEETRQVTRNVRYTVLQLAEVGQAPEV